MDLLGEQSRETSIIFWVIDSSFEGEGDFGLDLLREAQTRTVGFSMKHGERSVFGLFGQILDGLDELNCSEKEKLERWKTICQNIMHPNYAGQPRLEGCKAVDVKNILKTIYEEPEKLDIIELREIRRYIEYCRRWMLLRSVETGKMSKKDPQLTPEKFTKENLDVSTQFQRQLLYMQLGDDQLTLDQKKVLAMKIKVNLIREGLWDSPNQRKDLQSLRMRIESFQNSLTIVESGGE
jgi:hypothetical protein